MDLKLMNFPSLHPCEYCFLLLNLVLFVVGIYLGFFGSRKVWMRFTCIHCSIGAACWLLVPHHVLALDAASGTQFDGAHLHFGRLIGIFLVYFAVLYYIFQNTRDSTVFSTLLWSWVVLASMCLLVLAQIHFGRSKPPSKELTKQELFGCVSLFLQVGNVLGGLGQLYRLESWGGYVESFSWTNFHLRLDYLALMLIGIAKVAFPEWVYACQVVGKLDETHLNLIRIIGVVMIGTSLIHGRAPNFLSNIDKSKVFAGRLIMLGLLLASQIFAQLWYKNFTATHVFSSMFVCVVLTLSNARGYMCATSRLDKKAA